MKLIIIIPDDTVLATLSLARQTGNKNILMGTFHLCTDDLIDGNELDYRPKYTETEKKCTEESNV